jgi:hypothetical protein
MAIVTCVNATAGGNGVVVPVSMAGNTYQLIPFFFTTPAVNDGNTAVFKIDTGGKIMYFTPPQLMLAGAVLAPGAHTYAISADKKKLTITATGANIAANTKVFTYLMLGGY